MIALVLVELIAVVETDAVKRGSVTRLGGPTVREIPLFEIFTVREDEGVVAFVGVLFRVLAGDPQKYFGCGSESLVKFHLRLFGVFAVKKIVLEILFASLRFCFLRDMFLSFVV